MYKVKAPDLQREQPEPYYEYAMDLFERTFGARPSRTTLYGYLTKGFPIRRGGPRLQMPVRDDPITKRPQTTVEAMDRFISRVRSLSKKYPNRS